MPSTSILERPVTADRGRQRAQDNAVEDGEQRGIRADAQRQSHDRDERESRVLAQAANCDPNVVLFVAGLAIGLAGSLWAAQFLRPLLFQVEARDPATFAAAAGVLVAAGLLAAWLPARRAARLDPATVLREG